MYCVELEACTLKLSGTPPPNSVYDLLSRDLISGFSWAPNNGLRSGLAYHRADPQAASLIVQVWVVCSKTSFDGLDLCVQPHVFGILGVRRRRE